MVDVNRCHVEDSTFQDGQMVIKFQELGEGDLRNHVWTGLLNMYLLRLKMLRKIR